MRNFKGTTQEQKVVQSEKKVEELNRMIFAADLNLKRGHSFRTQSQLEYHKEELGYKLDDAFEDLMGKTSVNRYHDFMDCLEKEDKHRREKHGLKGI